MNVYPLLRPLLMALDAEAAHRLAIWGLKRMTPKKPAPDDPSLATRVFGLDFPNPVGIAAGFDKHGEAPLQLASLGFGFAEIGSVTPRPQPGNPRPRVFRLPQDRAVINRYGFNSVGLGQLIKNRIATFERHRWSPDFAKACIGINLGKNKDTPPERAAEEFAEAATSCANHASYLVINVSSPNTPGLRMLQGRAELSAILQAVRDRFAHTFPVTLANDAPRPTREPLPMPPLLLKIAPDLAEADLIDVAGVAREQQIDGLVVSNTTVRRPESLKSRHRSETGGLSGAPLKPFALESLRAMYRLTEGRVPLVGVGGIASGADAYERIRAGASLVQLYTALVYQGPALVGCIKRELAALLRRDGFSSVGAAVGADFR